MLHHHIRPTQRLITLFSIHSKSTQTHTHTLTISLTPNCQNSAHLPPIAYAYYVAFKFLLAITLLNQLTQRLALDTGKQLENNDTNFENTGKRMLLVYNLQPENKQQQHSIRAPIHTHLTKKKTHTHSLFKVKTN